MATLGLDVLRRGFDPEPGGARAGGSVHLEKELAAGGRDRQFRRDAGADAVGQDPFRPRARKARRRIVRRKCRRRNFRLCHRAAAAPRRAAVHHADRGASGAVANQAERRAQRSNDARKLSKQPRLRGARRQGDFRRRQRARSPGARANSSDRGRRRGRQRRHRLFRAATRSPWRGSTSREPDHRQLQLRDQHPRISS